MLLIPKGSIRKNVFWLKQNSISWVPAHTGVTESAQIDQLTKDTASAIETRKY